MIFADPRSNSDIWLVSVLLKLASIGISDTELTKKIEDLVDLHIERYVNTCLIKVAMLECALRPENPKHRDLILRRLRSMYLDNNAQV
jgi:hypothetical protein